MPAIFEAGFTEPLKAMRYMGEADLERAKEFVSIHRVYDDGSFLIVGNDDNYRVAVGQFLVAIPGDWMPIILNPREFHE